MRPRRGDREGRTMTATTTTTMDSPTITSRARNFGFGWTTDTEQVTRCDGSTRWRYVFPTTPSVRGGLAAIEREIELMRRVVSGGAFHQSRLFVDDRPVAAMRLVSEGRDEEATPASLRYGEWVGSYETIIVALRAGCTLEARFVDETRR